MKVVLKQDWIAPNGHRYHRSPAGGFTKVPDELVKSLPRSARVKGQEEAQEIREADAPEQPTLAREAELDRADDAAVLARIERVRSAAKSKE